MNTLGWIVLLTGAGGVASVLLAGAFLLAPHKVRDHLLPHLISFATGSLLGAALLGLLPHAMIAAGQGAAHEVGAAVLGGFALFFVLEKMVLWRHCHMDECESHGPTHEHRAKASGTLILVGDGIHNALDGVLIAAAFLTDWHLGLVTAIAVMTHEIPQEVGDFAILLRSGMSRTRALTLNALSGLTSVLGAVIAYYALADALHVLPYALAVAAASFLYVAVADLIPGLHRHVDLRSSSAQVVLIAAGVAVILFAEHYAHG
ncbi:MAG: ZIP family metal transporter [Steroidobacteraceae bacterium]